jgi:hypothetical protein
MKPLDLTEAAKAVLEAITVCGCSANRQAGVATQAVTAAAPLIERQVRERIATEIEAQTFTGHALAEDAYDHCARIARGES